MARGGTRAAVIVADTMQRIPRHLVPDGGILGRGEPDVVHGRGTRLDAGSSVRVAEADGCSAARIWKKADCCAGLTGKLRERPEREN